MMRPHIAYFSPLPPARSGIADYSVELLPHLAEYVDITLFGSTPAGTPHNLPIHPIHDYPAMRWQFDLPLYQMGNSHHHLEIYQMMCRFPGIMVLHDYVLHTFIVHHTAGEDNYAGFVRDMGYSEGMNGVQKAWAIKAGQLPHSLTDVPLNRRLLELNLATLVHSEYVKNLVESRGLSRPVHHIPALITPLGGQSLRHEMAWPNDAIIFALVGQLTPEKRFDLVVKVFIQLKETLPLARLLIVGEMLPGVDIPNLLAGHNLHQYVYFTDFVPDFAKFLDWIATADVVINLRHPTLGETSAATLRAMASQKPVIVFDHGWYAELPAGTAYHIPPLDEIALFEAMLQLAQELSLRQQIGQKAFDYVTDHHAPGRTAQAYHQAIQETLAN